MTVENHRDPSAGIIVLDSDTSLHTDVECACMACGQVSVVARMDQERSAFSDVFSYADFKMETTDGWAFLYAPSRIQNSTH